MDLIPGWGTKIPHALGQLILCMEMKTQGSQKKKKHKNGAGMCVCLQVRWGAVMSNGGGKTRS